MDQVFIDSLTGALDAGLLIGGIGVLGAAIMGVVVAKKAISHFASAANRG